MASSSSPPPERNESGKSGPATKRCMSEENHDGDEIAIVSPDQDENQERRVKKRIDEEERERKEQIKEKLQQERKTLPICRYRDELLNAVDSYQVVIIVAETGYGTGYGKTTQIPQYLYEAGYGKKGRIGCTQPYGFTARRTAARVSQEIGVDDIVGYSLPFEDCTSEKTVLRYMSDEALLHQIYEEPDLIGYSVLMVDDAHERTLSTDILLGLLKDILPSRPNLKLVISTATIDSATKIREFFDSFLVIDVRILEGDHNRDVRYLRAPEPNYLNATIGTVVYIHENEPISNGDVLVFLTDRDEIEVAAEELRRRIPHDQLSIRPFYENMSAELEALFLES